MSEQTNQLIHEKSPYLLQHAHNPVDWYPWGEAAFARAVAENKPIFLSIGYATCHWCHVMEKESFEDQAVADLLNRDYICIKVDREERPDIDQVYMDVCVRLTGSGGWPLTLFLLPDRRPFFAGTYFPKESQPQRPGLLDYLPLIAGRWQEQPQEFGERAGQIVSALQAEAKTQTDTATVTAEIFTATTDQLQKRFDPTDGGFGAAPKFPAPHNLAYLLRRYRREQKAELLQIVTRTLHAMRQGGIFDQIGFGFHRYSTDRQWLVPHFEKMLYDQAGLAEVYLDAFQLTQEPAFAQTARQIFTYVRRDLTAEQGGFYSAQDADSEGVEGKYYLWTVDDVVSVLGADAGAQFCRCYNLDAAGNYRDEATRQKTGQNIPHLAVSHQQLSQAEGVTSGQLSARLEASRERLLATRLLRVAPLTDDKVLTAWNGMMISALAAGGRILDDRSYVDAADRAADFILTTLRRADGSLLRRYRDGEAAITAFAEDYAFLARGVLDLYRATFNPLRLHQAIELAGELATRFMDAESGLIYETEGADRELIVRPKNLFDGAHPSTNSVALQLFARLGLITGDLLWRERGMALLNGLSPALHAYPTGFTSALQGAALLVEPTRQIVLTGQTQSEALQQMIQISNRKFLPEVEIVLLTDNDNGTIRQLAPFTQQMQGRQKTAAAYVCQNHTCQEPITDLEELASLLQNKP